MTKKANFILSLFLEKLSVMAGSVNKVIIVGNLGTDPEVRTISNGAKVARLNIATSLSLIHI